MFSAGAIRLDSHLTYQLSCDQNQKHRNQCTNELVELLNMKILVCEMRCHCYRDNDTGKDNDNDNNNGNCN